MIICGVEGPKLDGVCVLRLDGARVPRLLCDAQGAHLKTLMELMSQTDWTVFGVLLSLVTVLPLVKHWQLESRGATVDKKSA